MSKRYRLLLIAPRLAYPHLWNLREVSELMGKKLFSYPLALPLVAALTPSHYDIRIVHEDIERVPFDAPVDLVGITAMVPTIDRAYEIADRFRSRGVPVVLGGTHVTFNTDEALRHATAVVAGEAEGAWERCCADFEAGRLGGVYRAAEPPPFKTSPVPRWDLVDTSKLLVLGVQASRGCPYRCEFCLVSKMFGNRMRYREQEDLLREIRSLPKAQLFFVDDNLTANKEYARLLMPRLEQLRVSWSCQASIDVADDEQLLAAMARAGCMSIVIGFESVDPAALAETRKFHNRIRQYEEAIRRVHAAGIHVIAAFIVGFDVDTPETFEHIYDFTTRNNISQVMLSTLTVLPGTDLTCRMGEDGRLTGADRRLINGVYPCMRYRNFSQEELYHRYMALLERLYDYGVVEKKARAVLGSGAFAAHVRCQVPLAEKTRVTLAALREFVFTGDSRRRRLFRALLPCALRGTVAMEKLLLHLLFMEGFHRYPSRIRRFEPEVLPMIRRMDPGPLAGPLADGAALAGGGTLPYGRTTAIR